MRTMLIAAVSFIALAANCRPSEARPWYPWCAEFTRSNIMECQYVTFDQCLDTVRGVGGTCYRNYYPAPTGRVRRHDDAWHPFYH